MDEAQMEASSLFKSMSTISIVYGIILIVISMFLFVNTQEAYKFATSLLGVYLIVKGLIDFIAVFNARTPHRGMTLFVSIVYALAGFFVVMNPLFAGTFLVAITVYIIAFAFILGGIVSFKDSKLMAIVNILIGILMLFFPQVVAYGFVWVIALVILLGGIFTIVFGAMANNVAREIEA